MSGRQLVDSGRRQATSFPAPPTFIRSSVPILLRPGAQIQFGTDPRFSLILPIPRQLEPGPIFTALLNSAGGAGLEVELSKRGVDENFARSLIHDLTSAGLTTSPTRQPVLTLIGAGEFKEQLHANLRSSTKAHRVQSRAITRQTATWLSKTPQAEIGLAVLVGVEIPTLPFMDMLWQRRVPHLVVTLRDDNLVIGPFVSPPHGPCVMCLEAHRRDRDPAREILALQLRGRTASIDSHWLSAAKTVVEDLLRRGDVAQFGGCEVHVNFSAPHTFTEDFLPHPNCPICAKN